MSYLILDVHFVELINTADSVIGQHESARLDHKLIRLLISGHGRGQTSGRRRLTTRVDGSGRKLFHLRQEVGLGRGRITHYTNVNVTAKASALQGLLGHAPEQHEHDTCNFQECEVNFYL